MFMLYMVVHVVLLVGSVRAVRTLISGFFAALVLHVYQEVPFVLVEFEAIRATSRWI